MQHKIMVVIKILNFANKMTYYTPLIRSYQSDNLSKDYTVV